MKKSLQLANQNYANFFDEHVYYDGKRLSTCMEKYRVSKAG